MSKYLIKEFHNKFHVVEVTSGQNISSHNSKKEAKNRKRFLENGGAFNGHTPSFILQKLVVALSAVFMILSPVKAAQVPWENYEYWEVDDERNPEDDVGPGYNHDAWNDIREMLYGATVNDNGYQKEQIINDGEGVIHLDTPYRAMDAAVVPVSIVAGMIQTKETFIESITLVIDQNPSPIAAVFHFTPDSGLASVDTRIRINAYTKVRAIAQMNDGRLFMSTKFIKASGGCSVPGLSGMEEAQDTAGQMKMKFFDLTRASAALQRPKLGMSQLMIRHPNFSGLQMDQVNSQFIPAHYVDSVVVTRGGRKIFSVDSDISISENPMFRFYYGPETRGTFKVVATDSMNKTYEQDWPVILYSAEPSP